MRLGVAVAVAVRCFTLGLCLLSCRQNRTLQCNTIRCHLLIHSVVLFALIHSICFRNWNSPHRFTVCPSHCGLNKLRNKTSDGMNLAIACVARHFQTALRHYYFFSQEMPCTQTQLVLIAKPGARTPSTGGKEDSSLYRFVVSPSARCYIQASGLRKFACTSCTFCICCPPFLLKANFHLRMLVGTH